jgi:hypothetical protein
VLKKRRNSAINVVQPTYQGARYAW